MKAALVAGAGLILVPLILLIGVLTPSSAYNQVPLATPSQVKLYQDAAKAVGEARNVSIAWEDLLVYDTVARKQDFSGISQATVEALARQFTEHHEKQTCQPPPNETDCTTEEWWTVYNLDDVMTRAGWSDEDKAWAISMRAAQLEGLVDVGVSCVPGTWTPNPLAPWRWPLDGYTSLSSCFGPRFDPVEHLDGFHYGIDIPAPTGTPIYAAAAGVVTLAGPAGTCGTGVSVDHGPGAGWARYCHMSGTAVRVSQRVAKGDLLGYVGSTGKSTGPHLHLEDYEGGRPVDPLNQFR